MEFVVSFFKFFAKQCDFELTILWSFQNVSECAGRGDFVAQRSDRTAKLEASGKASWKVDGFGFQLDSDKVDMIWRS